jgi:hypothetical protein
MELYQVGFLEFLLEEVFETKELAVLGDSLTRYWIYTIKDDTERTILLETATDLIFKNSLVLN